MVKRIGPADDLTILLQECRTLVAGTRRSSEVEKAQLEFLLARITALSAMLARTPDEGSARVAVRLLLSDLAMVIAQFRGHTHDHLESIEAIGASLAESQRSASSTDT